MKPNLWMQPPRVVAHRGANREAPENTLAAFLAAVDAGVRAVELDARLTSDGVVVVHHDRLWGRTTSGDGPVEESLAVEAVQRVPTLESVLRALPADVLVNVELKADALNGLDLPTRAAEVVAQCGAQSRVLGTSFDAEMATDFAHRTKGPAGIILPYAPDASDIASWPDLAFVALVHDACDPETLRLLRDAGRVVYAWTVNDAVEARRLLAGGVAGVITDDPRGIARAIS